MIDAKRLEELIAELRGAAEPKRFGVLPTRKLYGEAATAIASLKAENERLMRIILWAERRLDQRGYPGVIRRMLERQSSPEDHTPIVQSAARASLTAQEGTS